MAGQRSIRKWGFIFIAPGVLWYALFMVYPMYYVIFLSFRNWRGPGQGTTFGGLRHYQFIFQSADFYNAFANTFILVAIVVVVATSLSLVISFLLTKIKLFQGTFRAMYFLPTVAGVVAIGIIWQWVWEPRFGVLNFFLGSLGLPNQRWIRDSNLALYAVAIVKIWMRLGFNVVVYLAGLLSIPQEFYDAAEVDGASVVRRFFHITIPLVMPITAMLVILNTIDSLQVIGEIFMLTFGGPGGATTTVGFLMYLTAFSYLRMDTASAMGLTLLLVILLITVVQRYVLEKRITEY